MGFLVKKHKVQPKEHLENEPISESSEKKSRRRTTECIDLSTRFLYRRAFSETQLLDVLPDEFKSGHAYVNITAGDVDALSYLKVILRQQNLEYCLFSTWCMAAEDILQIEEWIAAGRIKKLDAYVGEIFPNSYRIEYNMLKKMIEKHSCGRIAVFKNHSKCFAGYGDKFHFAVWTSANINTNPRTENGIIIVDEQAYNHARDYYDGIKSFEKNE